MRELNRAEPTGFEKKDYPAVRLHAVIKRFHFYSAPANRSEAFR